MHRFKQINPTTRLSKHSNQNVTHLCESWPVLPSKSEADCVPPRDKSSRHTFSSKGEQRKGKYLVEIHSQINGQSRYDINNLKTSNSLTCALHLYSFSITCCLSLNALMKAPMDLCRMHSDTHVPERNFVTFIEFIKKICATTGAYQIKQNKQNKTKQTSGSTTK